VAETTGFFGKVGHGIGTALGATFGFIGDVFSIFFATAFSTIVTVVFFTFLMWAVCTCSDSKGDEDQMAGGE
jgi:hypothetical protein